MGGSTDRQGPPAISQDLSPEERRWLHDKYERLAAEEGSLAGTRTAYFAGIGTILITGLLVLVVNLLAHLFVLLAMVSVLAALGILICVAWTILLGRTLAAQDLWRQAARALEAVAPPVVASIKVPIPTRGTTSLELDIARPFLAHQARFPGGRGQTWVDRADPRRLMEMLPLMFIVFWVLAIVGTGLAVLVFGNGIGSHGVFDLGGL